MKFLFNSRKVRWLALAASMTVAGCSAPKIPQVKETTQEVVQKLPPAWQVALPHEGSKTQMNEWWQKWEDSALSALQKAAWDNNPSLLIAAARIEQARANLAATGAAALPSVDLNTSARRSALGIPPFGAPRTSVSASFDAGWEIDLFGGVARTREAAAFRVQARELDWHEARVTLAADVANSYYNYRILLEITDRLRDDAKAIEENLRLTDLKIKAGFTAPADAALLRASLANAKNQITAQVTEANALLQALSFLSGLSLGEVQALVQASAPTGNQVKELPFFAVTQVPAQALAQRPDLAVLEAELAALAADIGVAEANRKPRLTLTGNIGWSSLRFGGANGAETASGLSWGFGPALSLPIFDAGRRQALSQAAQARYKEVAASYQVKARVAVREVEDALLRLESARERETQAQAAIKDFQTFLAASNTRWQVGVGSLIELQEARRQTVAAQINLVQLKRERALQWLSLYKALGGGWQAAQ